MSDSNHSTTIIVAVIGLIGSTVVALISNWDKFSGAPKVPKAVVSTPMLSVSPVINSEEVITYKKPSIINISGNWGEPDTPTDGYSINQEGNLFQFSGWGMLPQGIGFKSTGSGTINGQKVTTTYITVYQNGWNARGSCSGNVSSNGSRMTSTCTDNVLGTFVMSGVRQ